jgi:hypothetical protein
VSVEEVQRFLVCPPIDMANLRLSGLTFERCSECRATVSVAPSSDGVLARGAKIICYGCANSREWSADTLVGSAKDWRHEDMKP